MLKKLVLFIGLAFLFSSCVTLYTPTAINAPLLSEQGQLNASLSGLGPNGTDLQASYAVTNNLGLMFNYAHITSSRSDEIYDNFGNYVNANFKHTENVVEFGAGYFTKFNFTPKDNGGRFEVYGAFGTGSVIDNDGGQDSSSNYPKSTLNYTKFYLQPAIGYAMGNVEIAFATRVESVQFHNLVSQVPEFNGQNVSFVAVEPVLIVRAGFPNFKFTTQTGLFLPGAGHIGGLDIIMFSMGIQGTIFTGKNKEIIR